MYMKKYKLILIETSKLKILLQNIFFMFPKLILCFLSLNRFSNKKIFVQYNRGNLNLHVSKQLITTTYIKSETFSTSTEHN